MPETIYFSISGLKRSASCARKEFYNRNKKDYAPAFRSASMLRGSAVHAAIQALHENPGFDPIAQFDMEFEEKEMESTVPIRWPKPKAKGITPRDNQLKEGRLITDYYWRANGPDSAEPADVRSSERWFYVEIPLSDGTVGYMRGRLDQIRNINGKLAIVELKTGDMPPVLSRLARDPQCALEAFALKYGMIQIGEAPYIGTEDKTFHRHEFQLETDGDVQIYGCKFCQNRFEHFNAWPEAVYLCNVKAYVPYSADMKVGIDTPRANPWYRIDVQAEHAERLVKRLADKIMAVRHCEKTNVWPATSIEGWNGPCEGCDMENHCKDLDVCAVREGL